MTFERVYARREPERADVDAVGGPVLVEFGSPTCGWCRTAQPLIAEALERHPAVRHFKIEDGSGRALGRSFGIRLWPTLVVLSDGTEAGRLVRPQSAAAIEQALQGVDATGSGGAATALG